MLKVPDVIQVTDLRQDAAAALEFVRRSRRPVVITARGRAMTVLLSIDAYQQREHERELLLALARGEQEIAAGKGHTLASVLADADRLLATD